MRLKPLLLLALVIGIPIALWLQRPEPLTPREELANLRAAIESRRPDEQNTLRRLTRLLRDARDSADRDLQAELLDTRAAFFAEVGSAESSKRDLEELLSNHRSGDADLRLRLALAEVRAGSAESGIAMLESLTEDEPDRLEPWVELGVLRRAKARELVAEAAAVVRPLVVREDHERAIPHLVRLAAQDPDDPRRGRSNFTLRELVGAADASELARALVIVDEAAEETAVARSAFAESFALGLDQRAVSGFLEILAQADVDDLAVQFGTLGLRSTALEDGGETARLLVELLLERKDHAGAAQVARITLESGDVHEPDHLRLLCLALYRGKLWGPLNRAAGTLAGVGRGEDPLLANFWSALARSHVAPSDSVARLLRSYALSDVREPFPGARAEAWFALARVARRLEDARSEQEALMGGLAADPDDRGAEWLRLAELQRDAPHVGYDAPLVSYTRGMSQAPRRTGALLEDWIALGERALAGGGRDLPAIEQSLRRRGRLYPAGRIDPYLCYRLAERCLEQGRVPSAASILRQLLEEFPDLLPAFDLMIRCHDQQGKRTEEVEWIVRRVELAGADETSRELLGAVEPEELSDAQRVRLMEADPANLGRLYVANQLAEAGDLRGALLALRAAQGERADTERLAEGEILFRMGRFEEALPTLLSIEKESPEASESLATTVLAAWYLDKTRLIPVLVGDILAATPPSPELALEAGDLYLRVDRPAEAETIFTDFETEYGAEAEVLLRLAVAALIQAEDARAAEESRDEHDLRATAAIDRAEALTDTVQVPVARLLAALSVGDEIDRDRATRDLSAYDVQAPPLMRAIAEASADSWEEAHEIVEAELPGAALATPEDAVWGLLSIVVEEQLGRVASVPPSFGRAGGETVRFWKGTAAEPRSSDEPAALLLACETPGFEHYALRLLRDQPHRSAVGLWPGFLQARLLERLDELWQARAMALRVVDRHPDFVPAWTLLERIEARRLGAGSPQLEELRRQRQLAGNPVLSRANRALEDVRAKIDAGDFATAAAHATSLLAAAPEWLEAAALLARAREGEGQARTALALWKEICLERPTKEGEPYVDDYVAAISRLRADPNALALPVAVSQLEALTQAYPSHPLPVLERAAVDFDQDPDNVAVSVQRALRRLADFRSSLEPRTLEEAHPGSLELWTLLCLRLDDEVALRVLREEREHAPGDPVAWRLIGRVQREVGRLEDSLATLTKLARMLPDGETQIELAETAVAMGSPQAAVLRFLREGMRLGADVDESRAKILTARSQLAQDRPGPTAQAIATLEQIWNQRAEIPRDRAAEVGLLYAQARMARGEPEDFVVATRVLGAAPYATDDPYLRATMRAMLGLAVLERRSIGD